MRKLYEQFVRERKYLKNVTPKTEAWYWQSWHALASGLPEDGTVPSKAFWTDRIAALRDKGVAAVSVNTYARAVNGARQAFCVNGRFFLAPQAVGAVGKWESWFWISTFPRPTVNSSFWSFSSSFRNNRFSARPLRRGRRALFCRPPAISGSRLSRGPFPGAAMPARLAGRGRPAESQSAARPLSSSAPAWSTSWQYAPAPGTAVSSPHPHWETIPAS